MNTQKITVKSVETTAFPGVRAQWFAKQAAAFETSRFGWMALMIMVQSCVGSIACMYILRSGASDLILAACAAITMGANAALIAQAPGKACLAAFYISVIANTAFILLNI
jgi:hypothetical protein